MRPWLPITPDDVASLIDLTVEGQDTGSMASLQREGIAALHRILADTPAAYLADEVGMGKTYQAMGLAAVLWNDHPDARILFVSPRENLQFKWVADYRKFFADNYRRPQGLGDDLVASVLFRRAVHRPVKFDRLPDWTEALGRRAPMAAFLRHTSFSRPVYLRAVESPSIDAYWREVQAFCARAGLHEIEQPSDLLDGPPTIDNIGYAANIAFARAANRRLAALAGDRPFFDLVILDEAQCLRNPGNQTNTILHELFAGQVERWLFMSATPAHGSPGDIVRVLNHYPEAGQLVDPELTEDLPRFQEALEGLMVRRSRRYLSEGGEKLRKDEYRAHDHETWAVGDDQIGVLSTLAMGLVQKGLVEVLGARGNRFKIGFLSSFESLQSSISGQMERDEEQGDWHVESGGTDETTAADEDLIDQLATDFRDRFGRDLPHPKLDAVASRLARLAYGTDDEPGGEKVLVFTRRVSTVAALRARLTQHHRHRVEARLARVWDRPSINWRDPGVETSGEDDLLDADPEAIEIDEGDEDLIRFAMQDAEWLGKYRRTFRATGRNALFFEDGWLRRLCIAGGVEPRAAAEAIPDQLWAEAWQHASRPSGATQSRYQADRLRYLAWHALDRCPEAFELDEETARPWRSAYQAALHEHLAQEQLDEDVMRDDAHRDADLVAHGGLWAVWDAQLATLGQALPAADPKVATTPALFERQVARSILGQVLRLSDTIVDLWAADQLGGGSMDALGTRFVAWVASDDPCAQRLRSDVDDWLRHLRTIIDSSLDGSGHSWEELARRETWPQLYQLAPVLGVTGGSGAQQRATQQFRTPGMPRVIVCTDTLKEGVDLHLFCDRVVHYGVAWTAGDQEQRVGRVDRYFSKIERRVRGRPAGEVHLEVGYPHVVRTIERRQVERVMQRQRQAERLMDSPLAGHGDSQKELTIGVQERRSAEAVLDPFAPPKISGNGRPVVAVSREAAERIRQHYAGWHASLVAAVHEQGGAVAPDRAGPHETQTLTFSSDDRTHELEWAFDGVLKRYAVTVTDPQRETAHAFSGGWRRRLRERRWVDEQFLGALVPTPDDPPDGSLPQRLVDAVRGAPPVPDESARSRWEEALSEATADEVAWESPHKAVLDVACGRARSHRVTLYAYQGELRLVGVVASAEQLAAHIGGLVHDKESLLRWARNRTSRLNLGYIDVHDRDGVVFGMHVLHGHLAPSVRSQLVREVAWRADGLESVITGLDEW